MNKELEDRIAKLESKLKDAHDKLGILVSVLSRYQFMDPRVIDPAISVLDRLDKLEK